MSENRSDALLSLRSRLRTPECSSQRFTGSATQTAKNQQSRVQDQLLGEFQQLIATYKRPLNKQDTSSTGENYKLLDHLASTPRPGHPRHLQTPANNSSIPGCLATTGAHLHNHTQTAIEKSHAQIQAKITSLSQQSTQSVSAKTHLYKTLRQPPADLPVTTPDGDQVTVRQCLGALQEDLADAEEKLHGLYEQWQACVRSEQDAWDGLRRDEEQRSPEPDTSELVEAVERESSKAEADIKRIEAVSRQTAMMACTDMV